MTSCPRIPRFFFSSLLFICFSCKQHKTLFESVSSSQSGIHFNNEIKETDSLNVLKVSNIYNGGGVGIGDFNQDGLPDIYFTGNLVPNKLYLNKGDFKFEDMGIGGLDIEFSAIFRRAFASRIFPPELVEKLGIQHVKGF